MTGRENLLRIFRHERPEWIPKDNDMHTWILPYERTVDPIAGYDWFGVHWTVANQPGPMVTHGTLLENITKWKTQVRFPLLDEYDFTEDAKEFRQSWDRETQVGQMTVCIGLFERLHCLIGFEKALLAFYDEPEAVKDFFAALTDFKIGVFRKIKEYYDPDILIYHDDWGSSRNMFFSPQIWREFFRPCEQRMIDAVHDLGMFFEQHSCGRVEQIIGDLVELGVDAVQPLQAEINDLEAIKRAYGDKIVIRGGINMSSILSPAITEAEIRTTIRDCMRTGFVGDNFIPRLVPCGPEGAWNLEIAADEILRFEHEEWHRN